MGTQIKNPAHGNEQHEFEQNGSLTQLWKIDNIQSGCVVWRNVVRYFLRDFGLQKIVSFKIC